jgi:hypothetical protein
MDRGWYRLCLFHVILAVEDSGVAIEVVTVAIEAALAEVVVVVSAAVTEAGTVVHLEEAMEGKFHRPTMSCVYPFRSTDPRPDRYLSVTAEAASRAAVEVAWTMAEHQMLAHQQV